MGTVIACKIFTLAPKRDVKELLFRILEPLRAKYLAPFAERS